MYIILYVYIYNITIGPLNSCSPQAARMQRFDFDFHARHHAYIYIYIYKPKSNDNHMGQTKGPFDCHLIS